MDILIFIGLLIIGGLFNFIWEPGAKPVHGLAKAFLLIIIYLAVAVWVFYFAGITNAFLLKSLGFLLRYGGYLSRVLLGYLVGNILMGLLSKETESRSLQLKSTINITLWAVAISAANSFLVATVGKATHMSEMIGFFKQSGYAIWFLYFIMATESACALAIVFHFKLGTGIYASAGLMLIMLGAVYTHWHNKDPFSDSYAAVIQLMNLSILVLIYYFEKQVKHVPADTQIYVI